VSEDKKLRPGQAILGAARIRAETAVSNMVRNGDPLAPMLRERADHWEAAAHQPTDSRNREAGVGGELVSYNHRGLVDTVRSPTLVTETATRDRLELADNVRVLEMTLDVAETIQAENSIERMMAAQIAGLHKICMKMAQRGNEALARMEGVIDWGRWDELTIQAQRLVNGSVRASDGMTNAVLALQKLRTGGGQTVTVQHVTVGDGGQAIVAGKVGGSRGRQPRGDN